MLRRTEPPPVFGAAILRPAPGGGQARRRVLNYAGAMTVTQPVANPEQVGLDPERLEALETRARREIDSGLLPSCQLAVARHGQLGYLRTLGGATDDNR